MPCERDLEHGVSMDQVGNPQTSRSTFCFQPKLGSRSFPSGAARCNDRSSALTWTPKAGVICSLEEWDGMKPFHPLLGREIEGYSR